MKTACRALNLQLTLTAADLESDSPHFIVNGQCDLGALAPSFRLRKVPTQRNLATSAVAPVPRLLGCGSGPVSGGSGTTNFAV